MPPKKRTSKAKDEAGESSSAPKAKRSRKSAASAAVEVDLVGNHATSRLGLTYFRTSKWPPATIALSSAEPIELSANDRDFWASEAGGQVAARRGHSSESMRLVGSTTLNMSCSSNKPHTLAKVLGLLQRPVAPRKADLKWGWNRRVANELPAAHAPTEPWDKTNGEVPGQGFASPAAILKALYDGDVMCDEEWACELLEAIATLSGVI